MASSNRSDGPLGDEDRALVVCEAICMSGTSPARIDTDAKTDNHTATINIRANVSQSLSFIGIAPGHIVSVLRCRSEVRDWKIMIADIGFGQAFAVIFQTNHDFNEWQTGLTVRHVTNRYA